MPDGDELAFVRDERDHFRAQLKEIQLERDRLRGEIRDALSQVEYWRTLAEYRKGMLDAEKKDKDASQEPPPTSRFAQRLPRRRRRIA